MSKLEIDTSLSKSVVNGLSYELQKKKLFDMPETDGSHFWFVYCRIDDLLTLLF